MQLHLMLKIFVSDAWLAPWIVFENFCSEFFGRRIQYAKHVLFSHSTVEKEFCHSCHRNLLQTSNVDQELSLLVIKLTTLRRKIIQ